ncbi:hypothetical protein AB5I41_19475 [Sphingomonas sp. MMS24-JH45]
MRHALEPTPQLYELALGYVDAPDGPLAREIRAMVDGGLRLTAQDVTVLARALHQHGQRPHRRGRAGAGAAPGKAARSRSPPRRRRSRARSIATSPRCRPTRRLSPRLPSR